MKLTIIPVDGAVAKDGKFYINLNLSACNIPSDVNALQWTESTGWIEFTDTRLNQDINELPSWAVCCVQVWDTENTPAPPTTEQIMAQNKSRAEYLLSESDWTVLPDVPLANKTDWEIYRSALREIAVNPTVDPVWPTKPDNIWS
jgi:hypothetical protein